MMLTAASVGLLPQPIAVQLQQKSMVAPIEKHLPGAMSYPAWAHPVMATGSPLCWCDRYIAVSFSRRMCQDNLFVMMLRRRACSLILACRYLLMVGWFELYCVCPQSILRLRFCTNSSQKPCYMKLLLAGSGTSHFPGVFKDVLQCLDCKNLGRVRKNTT